MAAFGFSGLFTGTLPPLYKNECPQVMMGFSKNLHDALAISHTMAKLKNGAVASKKLFTFVFSFP